MNRGRIICIALVVLTLFIIVGRPLLKNPTFARLQCEEAKSRKKSDQDLATKKCLLQNKQKIDLSAAARSIDQLMQRALYVIKLGGLLEQCSNDALGSKEELERAFQLLFKTEFDKNNKHTILLSEITAGLERDVKEMSAGLAVNGSASQHNLIKLYLSRYSFDQAGIMFPTDELGPERLLTIC